MFSKNKKLQDQLNNQIDNYKTGAEDTAKALRGLTDRLDSLKVFYDDELDEMHGMEGVLQNRMDLPGEIDRSSGIIRNGLNFLIERDKSSAKNNEDEENRWRQSIDTLSAINEAHADTDRAADEAKAPFSKAEKEAAECSNVLKQMSALSQSMSVAALNSAIEAGHLGEMGERYVETAEKLRELSEEYRIKAESADKMLSSIMELFNRSSDALMHLLTLVEKEDASLKKLEGMLGDNLAECNRFGMMEEKLSADSLVVEMDRLEELLAEDRENRNRMLERLQFLISDAEKGHDSWKDIQNSVADVSKLVNEIRKGN